MSYISKTTANAGEMPQSIDAERAVLGCCLLEPVSLIEILDKVTAEMFYAERHRIIWEAIMALTEKAIPPDMLAVTEELRNKKMLDKIGGATYLAELPSYVGSTGNIEYYAGILRQKYVRRRMLQAAEQIKEIACSTDGDINDQSAEAEKVLMEATKAEAEGTVKSLGEVAQEFWDYVYGNRDETIGTQTGFKGLDRATGGLQRGDMIVLAARPGEGKTTLAMQIAYNVAKSGKPAIIFSLEMAERQVANRLLVGLGKFDNQAIRQRDLGNAEWDVGFDLAKKLKELPLFVDDQAGATLAQIRARARRLKSRQGDLGLVVVDYLQLMRPTAGKSREEQIGLIAQGMKEMAKELDVPVLVLSQLNRAVEYQAGKRPMLSNLRESGNIEQAADVVIFIHQPDEESNNRELLIEKQRMLPTGVVRGLSLDERAWFREVVVSMRPAPAPVAQEAERLFRGGRSGK